MSFAVIESMTTFQRDGLTIRIWQAEDEVLDSYDRSDLELRLGQILFNMDTPRIGKVAEALANLPGVNAVEVKNAKGNGIVLYKEWP